MTAIEGFHYRCELKPISVNFDNSGFEILIYIVVSSQLSQIVGKHKYLFWYVKFVSRDYKIYVKLGGCQNRNDEIVADLYIGKHGALSSLVLQGVYYDLP